jgi:hypothetical protein
MEALIYLKSEHRCAKCVPFTQTLESVLAYPTKYGYALIHIRQRAVIKAQSLPVLHLPPSFKITNSIASLDLVEEAWVLHQILLDIFLIH